MKDTHPPDSRLTFPCLQCDKIFTWKRSLNHHIKTHHEDSFRFCCDVCGMKFIDKSYFEVHSETHNPHRKCEKCGQLCKSKLELKLHTKSHLGEFSYKCDVCGKGFHTEPKYLLHYRTHTGEKPFQCTECERRFSRKDKLNEHFRRHTGQRIIKCDFCEYLGYDSSDVIHHKERKHRDKYK